MKKIILIFILFISVLSANNAEEKIYTSILNAIFPTSYEIKVWVDDAQKRHVLKQIRDVNVVSKISEADILFIFHKIDIRSNKLKFVGSYALLKRYKKDALGGFYWQKGRPNLLFLKHNLDKKHLTLPREFSKYIDKRL